MEDGGSAFPYQEDDIYPGAPGMNLWEYYAGEALKGLTSHKEILGAIAAANPKIMESLQKLFHGEPEEFNEDAYGGLDGVAEIAFDFADAMIKERKKRMEKNANNQGQ